MDITARVPDSEELSRKAEIAEEHGRLTEAFEYLLNAARLGNVGSQLNLGNFYSLGRGVGRDLKQAAFWYKKAFKNGLNSGAYNLGVDYKNQGNLRSAIFWFSKTAAQNHGGACVDLAKLYLGQGDADKAKKILTRTTTMNNFEISDQERDEVAALFVKLDSSYR